MIDRASERADVDASSPKFGSNTPKKIEAAVELEPTRNSIHVELTAIHCTDWIH